MTGLRAFIVAAASLSTMVFTVPSANGATVRRHVHCAAYASGVTLPLVNQTLSGVVQITNNWSFAIGAGTVYTYTYRGHAKSYKSPTALAPGAVLSIADANVLSTETCDATYPEPAFTISPNVIKNLPNATLHLSP